MEKMILIILVPFFFANVQSFLFNFTQSQGPIADTECGKVQGIAKSGSFSFRGIPYALPPTGTRRWKKPVPLSNSTSTCWKGVFQAVKYGNTCIQQSSSNTTKFDGSEDCLYLNIWTPRFGPKLLPVMVWVHGGSLESANGNWPSYSPNEKLAADTNVVYVSMNYRLNAFGFMALDILSKASPTGTSGNYGLMDQVLALQWVQRNIKNFGGDPNQVTLFGQSSGGTSVFALLAAPACAGLFHRAWMMSASPLLNKTTAEASKDNEIFLRNTGCTNVSCLYDLEADEVMNAIPYDVYPYWAMGDLGDLPVNGVFDGALAVVDGDLIPKAPFEAWKDGEGIDVPLIIGTTAQEIDAFPTQIDLKQWNWTVYEERVREKLDTFGKEISAKALKLYPSTILTPEYQYTSMVSDLRVSCGNNKLASFASKYFRSPVFRYVVTARPTQPLKGLSFPFPGSYSLHTWDAYAFFGTIKDFYTIGHQDNMFMKVVRNELLSFVTTGRPNSADWSIFPNSTAIIDTNLTLATTYQPEKCSFWLQNGFFDYSWVN